MALVSIAAVGSVDDGKSTLLGRLLLDAGTVRADERDALAEAARRRGREQAALAFVTDGLAEERSQGVTVDLAYRTLEGLRGRLCVVDCPGHQRFAASTTAGVASADGVLVALDALRGLGDGARAHLGTLAVLGAAHVVVALTKMDSVNCSEERFAELSSEVRAWLGRLCPSFVEVLPTAAVDGDQVVRRSGRLGWFEGPTLLEALSAVEPVRPETAGRVVVQGTVLGSDGARWVLGRLFGGDLGVGTLLKAPVTGEQTVLEHLVVSGRSATVARHGAAVALGLADPLCVARGELLVDAAGEEPLVTSEVRVRLRWLGPAPLRAGWQGEARLAGAVHRVALQEVAFRLDLGSPAWVPATGADRGDLVEATLVFARPVVVDPYRANRDTGSVILADPVSLEVVGMGAIADHRGAEASVARRAISQVDR